MSEVSMREVSLASLGGGAAVEKFDDALAKALANIGDINTPAQDIRKITLEVRLKPSEQRDTALIDVRVSSKLPGAGAYVSTLFLGTDGSIVRAYEHSVKQGDLGLEKVTNFRTGGGA